MRITTGYWIETVMLIALPIGFALAAGCQQEMAEQPSYKPAQPSDFFADGRSERPTVPGTVARGHLHTDVAYFTGRRVGKNGLPLGGATPVVIQPQPDTPEAAKLAKAQYDQFIDTFPFPMTEQVLEHGYHRFMIYCVVCHDPLGTGRGKIVERGYTAPPSYHIERLRKAPVGYLFSVVSEGYGSMPSYGTQIPVRDRWAVVGYLRALQASQHFPDAKLTEEMRRERSGQDETAKAGGVAP
jgi:mono/diheme cytochrome c family protein